MDTRCQDYCLAGKVFYDVLARSAGGAVPWVRAGRLARPGGRYDAMRGAPYALRSGHVLHGGVS
jgi:hypothetical protein